MGRYRVEDRMSGGVEVAQGIAAEDVVVGR